MASIPIETPDELVDELVAALARRAAIAEPETRDARTALIADFFAESAAAVILEHQAQEAAAFVRIDPTSRAVQWRDELRAKRGDLSASDGGEVVGSISVLKRRNVAPTGLESIAGG